MTDTPLIVDGHVHITNRVCWESLDPWQPQPYGFDYAQANATGVRAIIENLGPYGYANYNYTPKQTLRLIEVFHRSIEEHADRVALALSGADARRIIDSGRMAVFLGIEAGFDHEGDPDVLRALYRLGLRCVQFSTQSCFNAFADAEIGNPVWGGINDRGRALIATMNELGMLIDITHATPAAQAQIIAASEAPVVAPGRTGFASSTGRACYFMASRRCLQACSQRRQASVQTRQCGM
jgi:membrane dipeptidase